MPLSRFTVLDLTRVRSGPLAVRQLADWGANVIKIEPPEAIDGSKGMGGERDGSDFQNTHRNKRGITLNLKVPEGRELFYSLVAKADVVAENYRPDVKQRLGIDYVNLKGINKRIVLASISGFGQSGPYARRPGFDQIAQGMGGLMSVTGLPGQGPIRAGIPVADLSAGLYAAIGILIALLERENSGEGQWVHTSLLEAQIAMMDFQATRWLIDKDRPGQAGNNHPTSIPTGLFRANDGMLNLAGGGETMWRRICEALELGDVLSRSDFSTEGLRSQNRDSLNAILQERFITNSVGYWVERLNAAGVPCGPVYGVDDMFADQHVAALDMRLPVDHTRLGKLDLLRSPVSMSRGKRQARATPERGQHTDEVLNEFGFTAEKIAALRAQDVV
ncbi:formyl-coenzyme A transferase [Variibacter gotjawalensis]|uniref:Formyl-coenzyme A transferase n=2 Tax=Variibacter gotjawalensis TaxID=1333996 RepID=A0A0S3PTY1_9BRAD|nr:CaiB/BaiF CoA-transferase family protein [Variibacter gotjawalensis]NIK49724.1 crotonobetainyl-CoA:carnitine CoA-transferase CaiB-like acyl-CoA transferase [Variibacter gotjawalensis]RZS45734.1 formyl-CoA transferase [Variibacter gotjawalensis]BAT59407.1 formyl-coenzyme A transferase [Variibacter gotjawalensis]